MIVPLPDGWAVAVSVVAWVVTCFGVGRWAVTWDAERLDRPGPITRLRRWERQGRFWIRHARVLRWKDRLPEAGAFFEGGQQKRHLRSIDAEGLAGFRRETIRAERVHWTILASGPLHLVWCRPLLGACMVAFGVLFDAPFIVVQRTNRGRLDRLIERRDGT